MNSKSRKAVKFDENVTLHMVESISEMTNTEKRMYWHCKEEVAKFKAEARLTSRILKSSSASYKSSGLDSMDRLVGNSEHLSPRGLECRLDLERRRRKHKALKAILRYHKMHKQDSIGLSIVACHNTQWFKGLAYGAGLQDEYEANFRPSFLNQTGIKCCADLRHKKVTTAQKEHLDNYVLKDSATLFKSRNLEQGVLGTSRLCNENSQINLKLLCNF